MILTFEDKNSSLWKRLKEHLADEIGALRIRNEGNLDIDATNRLRGRIAGLKALSDLDAERPVVEEFAAE